MKLASIPSLIAAALLAVGVAFSATDAQAASKKSAKVSTLEQALAGRQLANGWNKIVKIEANGDVVYAEASGGKIVAWQVKSAEGKDLRTHVRAAESADNLRVTWEPTKGPGRFLEAPASVIKP